jgi:hypothetical protein
MATTYSLALDFAIKLSGGLTKTDGEHSASFDPDFAHTTVFTNGSDGEDQANEIWVDRRELSTGTANETLDLSGSLTNFFGRTVAFNRIKLIAIENLGVSDEAASPTYTPTIGNHILVGNAASAQFDEIFDGDGTAVLKVESGGIVVLGAPHFGYDCVAGSTDQLKITYDNPASGGTIGYDIAIVGTV